MKTLLSLILSISLGVPLAQAQIDVDQAIAETSAERLKQMDELDKQLDEALLKWMILEKKINEEESSGRRFSEKVKAAGGIAITATLVLYFVTKGRNRTGMAAAEGAGWDNLYLSVLGAGGLLGLGAGEAGIKYFTTEQILELEAQMQEITQEIKAIKAQVLKVRRAELTHQHEQTNKYRKIFK